MEELTTFLGILNSLSPLAVIALLGLVIFMLVKAKASRIFDVPVGQARIAEQVELLGSNHLSDLPKMAEQLEKVSETLQRMEVTMSALDSYLRARLNGNK